MSCKDAQRRRVTFYTYRAAYGTLYFVIMKYIGNELMNEYRFNMHGQQAVSCALKWSMSRFQPLLKLVRKHRYVSWMLTSRTPANSWVTEESLRTLINCDLITFEGTFTLGLWLLKYHLYGTSLLLLWSCCFFFIFHYAILYLITFQYCSFSIVFTPLHWFHRYSDFTNEDVRHTNLIIS